MFLKASLKGAQAFIYAKNMQIRTILSIKVLPLHLIMDIEEDSKQYMEGGFLAHSGWRHPLLDVSRIRLQASRRCSASQDELDLDAAVVPFWHLCPALQRMEMETVAGTIRREGPQQYKHQLHLPVLCSESCNPSFGRVCKMRRTEEMGRCFVSESLGTVVTERAIDSLLVLLITGWCL